MVRDLAGSLAVGRDALPLHRVEWVLFEGVDAGQADPPHSVDGPFLQISATVDVHARQNKVLKVELVHSRQRALGWSLTIPSLASAG